MSIIDNRTTRLDLPLPNTQNNMTDDCARLITALQAIDAAMATLTDLSGYTNTTDLNTALGLKANTTDVNTALGLKADATALASKADNSGNSGQVFNVGPATNGAHAMQKQQVEEHTNATSGIHGSTPGLVAGALMQRDANGDVAARNFIGDVTGAASSVYNKAPNGGSATLVSGAMAGSDGFRILITGTDDGGWAEIATSDNGNEQIFVRQYSGDFVMLERTLTLLDATGNTHLPGQLFIGGAQWLETGSNANGTYMKFQDGTLICFTNPQVQNLGQYQWGIYNFTLPATFVGNAYPIASVHEVWDGGINGTLEIKDCALNPTGTVARVNAYSEYGGTLPITVNLAVIGRWK